MSRYEAAKSGDTSGVTTQPPKRKMPLIVWLMLGSLVATFAVVAIMYGGNSSQHEDRDGTPGYLCELLKSGWTTGDLATNSVWQDWPEQQSAISRGAEIVSAADRGGCLNLT